MNSLLKAALKIPGLKEFFRIYFRRSRAVAPYKQKMKLAKSWSFKHTEFSNYYYDITDQNRKDLAFLISYLTRVPLAKVEYYFNEIETDQEVHKVLLNFHSEHPEFRDSTFYFARRIGWYALTRITKPSLVVETGVHHGMGGLVLCAALRKNIEEGSKGQYLGIDINPSSGTMLTESFMKFGHIITNNSLIELKKISSKIDLFINDSDHDTEYEAQEYALLNSRLSAKGIILGDNAHASGALRAFSEKTGRDFLFFQEVPKNHFYPGAGIGISFRSSEFHNHILRIME